MTLLELLLKKLPEHFTKNGGWPVETDRIVQGATGIIYSNDMSRDNTLMRLDVVADDYVNHCVTREQYEAALAAAQHPVWDGEGLPPVGCECEFFDDGKWFAVKIMYSGRDWVVLFDAGKNMERVFSTRYIHGKFRPIRSEVDKKRAEIIEEIAYHTSLDDARDLYEAIAAGQVKGVKLDV